MNLSSQVTSYDVALQSLGQGYDDLTVMSMALLAAVAASPDSTFAGPTFEWALQKSDRAVYIS
jgi:hypothetical protein